MSEKWDPTEHHDEYQAALMAYIDEKISKGATAVVKGGERNRDSEVTASNTIDLAAYLEKSIMASKGSKYSKTAESKKPAEKNAAKKAAKKIPRKASKKSA